MLSNCFLSIVQYVKEQYPLVGYMTLVVFTLGILVTVCVVIIPVVKMCTSHTTLPDSEDPNFDFQSPFVIDVNHHHALPIPLPEPELFTSRKDVNKSVEANQRKIKSVSWNRLHL